MNVLIITNLFPNSAQPRRGLFNLQQVAALADACALWVVAPVPWRPRWRWLRRLGLSSVVAQIPAREVIEGITVEHPRYLAIPVLSRPFNGWLLYLSLRGAVRRIRREFPFDRILATWAYPDVVAAAWIAKAHRVPVIAKLHGSDVHVDSRGPIRRRLIVAALRRCRRIVAVSDALKDEIVRWGLPAQKVAVISNGVDVKRFQPRERAEARRALDLPVDGRLIVFIGNLVAVKGAAYLLEAFHALRQRWGGSPLTLAIVGAGVDGRMLQERATALGVGDAVRFVGAKPHEEIPQWLNAADVLCLPSVSEGCPNVVIEALACGTPVVATRVGGVAELVRDGELGFLVSPKDAEAMAAGLQQALTKRWDRQRLCQAVANRAWHANASRLLEVLSSMTVVHVLRYSIPNLSGYTMRSQALIEGQQAFGARPVVVTSARHEAPAERETLNGILYERCRLSRHPLLRWMQTALPGVRDLATMHALYRRIMAVARRESADLIHAHSPVMCGFPAWVAARRLGLPLIYEVRALWEDAAVDQEKTSEGALAYRLTRAAETFVLRRADRVVVICGGLKQELMQRGIDAAKIAVVPNGVNTAEFQPLTGKDEAVLRRYGLNGQTIIGFIGSFFQFEGLESLLAAVPYLRQRHPGIKVLIVGTGESEAALRRTAEASGVSDSVIFTGRVPHEQIHAYYSVMDVLVYPRLSRRITELVTPLKPLEAMALGKPVVASDVGGLKELVKDGETGLLFKAEDPQDLAAKCLRVATDRALADRLARHGRAYVEEEREWSTSCAATAALYRDVLGAPR